ncbi:hypothetical protein Sjap_004243 [Stephania japonica]|uniref:Uncharacterized protein n=1 Tax=Stephania japonica TaxID=461633 RepID=A0AAP0PK46_9MAGN
MTLFFWSKLQSDLIQMAVIFKYWDECLDPQDLEALWGNPEVSKQRIDEGGDRGQKVLLSRDPDGQPYLTQTEMTSVEQLSEQSRQNDYQSIVGETTIGEESTERISEWGRWVLQTTASIISISMSQRRPVNATIVGGETLGVGTKVHLPRRLLHNGWLLNTFVHFALQKTLGGERERGGKVEMVLCCVRTSRSEEKAKGKCHKEREWEKAFSGTCLWKL